MRNISTGIAALLFMALFFSCEKRHIDDNIPASVVNFSRAGLRISEFYDVEGVHTDTFYVTNAGFEIPADIDVTVAVDETGLGAYNESNGTDYQLLPPSCYALEQVSGKVTASHRTHPFLVVFDCEAFGQLENPSQYVLPIRLSGSQPEAIGEQSLLIVQPHMLEAQLALDGAGVTEVRLPDAPETPEYRFTVSAGFESRWDINFELIEGQAVLDEYNAAHQTNYRALPEQAYTLESATSLSAGVSSADVTFSLRKADVPAGVYAIAVKLQSGDIDGRSIGIDADNIGIIRINNGSTTQRLDRSAWSISFFDSYGATDVPEKMLDGDAGSFWQPAWNASHFGTTTLPFTVVVDMGAQTTLEGFELWRRPGTYASDLRGGVFEVSTDGISWKQATPFDCGDVNNKNEGPLYFYCEPATCRYVRIYITASNRNNTSNMAEFFTLGN
ncbi:BT_3987 domain-containing protein [Parapedobacter defluvii]|nr:DUF1735 domain-containing protein [Parapedobacter defluvii]